MDQTIETQRLTLRTFTADDADFLFDMFRRPEVARWSGTGTPMAHRDEAVARIARQPERAGNHPASAFFLVTLRTTGAPLGTVLLVPLPNSEGVRRDGFEVGWHFHPDAWGHGYATEAATAMVERARDAGLVEVWAVTDLDNGPSQAVCRRLGMTDLGVTGDWYDEQLRAFRLDLT